MNSSNPSYSIDPEKGVNLTRDGRSEGDTNVSEAVEQFLSDKKLQGRRTGPSTNTKKYSAYLKIPLTIKRYSLVKLPSKT